MKTVQVTLEKYEEPVTFVAEDSPIVNDPDYVEVITTAPTIHYSYDGIECAITGDKKDTLKDLIKKVKSNVAWDKWFYDNADAQDFKDYGLNSPRVYDHEEDDFFTIRNIGNYVNNCRDDNDYDYIIGELQKIANEEIKVEIEHDISFEIKLNDESISGYMDLLEADDEAPLKFYDSTNQEQWYVPKNPNDMDHNYNDWLDYEIISESIFTCNIIQYLVDFAFEHKELVLDKTTDGGEIILVIN